MKFETGKSESLRISRERIRQLLQQAYRKTMRGLPNVVREKVLDVQKENDLLRKENERLKADNTMMRKLRNLGSKSLDEIIEFIDKLNLSWDWDVSVYTSDYIKNR